MITYAYDIECFKNLFTATFVNVDKEEEKYVFYIGFDKEDYSDLKHFLDKEMILIGYNSHSYDDPMLRFIINYEGDKVTSDAFTISSKLIDENYRQDKTLLGLRYPKNIVYPWKSIDLMRILAFDKTGISLKQTAINLKWKKIQDIPVNPNSTISADQLDLVLDYNLNDVLITKRLYEEITPIRELRADLSKMFSIDLSSASDSKMANMMLEHIYANELRVDIRSVRTMRTNREKVLLKDCIAKFVSFESPELVALFQRISSTYVYAYNEYRYSEKVSFAGCNFVLGVGGLHTEDTPGVFISDENYMIQDMDVASYYPNLIINNNFYPEHLGPNFIRVLKMITEERLTAKKKGDKVKADGLKITINSIFGKMGSEHFWLYDPKQFLSTTISGQLGLLMLVEGMYKAGIEVISCNTDGIVCKIHKGLEDKYYEVAHNWEKATNLELEFTPYKKYVRRDVNSYITEKADGSTKEKGAFLKEVDLKKSYHMPIVAKALYSYFINNVPVRDTIRNCRDIMEFCISQKSGANFTMELHKGNKIEKLQKTNRFFISTKGGALIKRAMFTNRLTGLYVGEQVSILNEYDENTPFENYNVDYLFYEKEVMKIINEIEPLQLNLFNLNNSFSGKQTKITMPSTSTSSIEREMTVFDLNKLGKNQLQKKIETIVENNEKIENLDPRYVYIDAFDIKSMLAIMYCLSKGSRNSIYVDKQAYKRNKVEVGQIVYCKKFEKRQNGHVVIDYRITEKLEEIGEKLI